MAVRESVALLVAVLVLGCDKKSTVTGGVGAGDGGDASGALDAAADQQTGSDAAPSDAAPSDAAPADMGPSNAVCVPVEKTAAGTHPDILVLLDASGSMANDIQENNCDQGCGANSKWALTTAAVNQVVAATSANVSWGLKFFADKDQMCTVSPGVSVAIGQGNATAIATAIASRTSPNGSVSNGGATPTRAAASAAVTYLSTIADSNPKFILLATDGQPNCPATGASDTDDSTAAIKAVSDANHAGVPTFVVGIGTLSSTEIVLNSLARAGGHPRPVEPAYHPASSTADLITALNQLVGIARTCRIAVTPPAGNSRDDIDVLANGTVIPYDATHTNGWDYADPSHTGVDLYGAACANAMSSATTRLSIFYRCPHAD